MIISDVGAPAGGASSNVNLLQIGGVTQSGSNLVDTTNSAMRVNIVAGGAGASGSSTVFQGTLPWAVVGSGGQVTALQGSPPWAVVGSGGLFPISGSATVYQGSPPWAIVGSGGQVAIVGSGGQITVVGSGGQINVGSATVFQGSPPWAVVGSGGLFPISGSATVFQGSPPWAVTGSGGQFAIVGSGGQIAVTGSGGQIAVVGSGGLFPVVGSGGQMAVVGSGGLFSVNLTQIGSQAIAPNAGISGSSTIRVVQATANIVNITQVTITGSTGGNQLIALNANRIKVRVTNTGTTACYILGSGVNVSTGDYLAGVAGYPWISRYQGALFGWTGSGTQLVTVYEEASQ